MDRMLLNILFMCELVVAFTSAGRTLLVENKRYPDNEEMMKKIRRLSTVDTFDQPVVVKVRMFIESLSSFRSSDMSFAMDVHISLSWRDDRFTHDEPQPLVFIEKKQIKHFWVPDLYFANSMSAQYQNLLRPNTYIRLYPNGEIHFIARVTLTAACSQDLRAYPLDDQYCGIKIRSYSHPKTKLVVKWFDRRPITAEPGIKLAELEVQEYVNDTCESAYTYAETDSYYMVGTFSCLFGGVRLRRLLGYHMVQTYIPTGLIVVISWVSFFIDPSAVPARVSLSFTTLLTLSTMAAGVRVSLPPVAYAKAIDIWVGVCMLFVFASLLQFAVVNSYMRSANSLESIAKMDEHRKQKVKAKLQAEPHSDITLLQNRIDELKQSKKNTGKRIDKVCRLLFPGSFLVFNIIYWTAYLS